MTTRHRLRKAVEVATAALAEAGIDTARTDAELLAAHIAGIERGRLAVLDAPDAGFFPRYEQAVAARSRRIPLQHLTGTAAFGPLELEVGPGVFIPRPETEALLEWVVAQSLPAGPLIVDLCTGSGALALALARRWASARVVAVDDDPAALDYACRNVRRDAGRTSVELVQADVTASGLLADLTGRVDLVVANPPYIPSGAWLEPEVAQHDPAHALFGGPDGMAVVGPVVARAATLLRPGGLLAVEHDDTTSPQTVEIICDAGCFTDITARRDLTGRPRFVTARKTDPEEPV